MHQLQSDNFDQLSTTVLQSRLEFNRFCYDQISEELDYAGKELDLLGLSSDILALTSELACRSFMLATHQYV